MEASNMANLDASLPQSVQSVNNPETPTAELNEAIIDLPAPSLAPTVNKPATLTIEIIETLPPSPAQFENKSATLAIVAIDLNNTNLDIPPFCPCPPERANIDLPSLCPLSAEAKSPTLAIDVEEGLQTPMTTDNALSVPGNEDDATLPADEMAIEESKPQPDSIPCGCLLYIILCPFMLAAVVLFAVGTALLFVLSCGRLPCGESDSGNPYEAQQRQQQQQRKTFFLSRGAKKSRFICDDDLNEITNPNRQYSGGSYV